MTAEQLASVLDSSNAEERTTAAQTLASMGSDASRAATTLVKYVAEEDVGQWCTAALEECGPPRREDLNGLCSLLDCGVADSVYWAATLLGRLGSEATDAVGPLTKTAEKYFTMPCGERAIWALGKIGPLASAATSVLKSIADSDQARAARRAKQAIASINR